MSTEYDVADAAKTLLQNNAALETWCRENYGRSVTVTIMPCRDPAATEFPWAQIEWVAEAVPNYVSLNADPRMFQDFIFVIGLNESDESQRLQRLAQFTDQILQIIYANPTITSTVIDATVSSIATLERDGLSSALTSFPFRQITIETERVQA